MEEVGRVRPGGVVPGDVEDAVRAARQADLIGARPIRRRHPLPWCGVRGGSHRGGEDHGNGDNASLHGLRLPWDEAASLPALWVPKESFLLRRGHGCGTRFVAVNPELIDAARRTYDVTVKQIDCVCGYVVKGEDDDELWEQAQEHLRTDHPELVGKVSRADILAQAEET